MWFQLLTNKYVLYPLIAVTLTGGGYLAGKYTTPEKVITETKEVVVEKIVEKKIFIKEKDQDIKKNEQIHIIETILPDGTVKKETFILNKDTLVIREKEDGSTEVVSDKTQTTDSKTVVVNKTSIWKVNGLLGTSWTKGQSLSDYKNYLVYGLSVEKRVWKNVYMGMFGTNTDTYGLSLGIGL